MQLASAPQNLRCLTSAERDWVASSQGMTCATHQELSALTFARETFYDNERSRAVEAGESPNTPLNEHAYGVLILLRTTASSSTR